MEGGSAWSFIHLQHSRKWPSCNPSDPMWPVEYISSYCSSTTNLLLLLLLPHFLRLRPHSSSSLHVQHFDPAALLALAPP